MRFNDVLSCNTKICPVLRIVTRKSNHFCNKKQDLFISQDCPDLPFKILLYKAIVNCCSGLGSNVGLSQMEQLRNRVKLLAKTFVNLQQRV